MFSQNDYELLYLVSEFNKQAENDLIKKYNLLVWKNVNDVYGNYTPLGVERDDLYQEGNIALYGAFNTFDVERCVPFYAFANLCIERSMIGYMRKYSTLATRQFYNSLSLDSFVSDEVSLYLGDVIPDNSEVSALTKYDETIGQLYLYSDVITDFEKNVLVMQVAGYSYNETALHLKCSVKKIDNTIQKIKRLLN